MRSRNKYTIDLPIAKKLVYPESEWKRISQGNIRIADDKKLAIDWDTYNQKDYLFSHVSIVASVNVAENGYYIESPTDELVNSNGNSWPTPILLATFKSFIGKPNYLEHFQNPHASKGKILDAVIRPVKYKGSNGEEANVFYTDLLVATDRRHSDLVRKIEASELDTLSMGCCVSYVTCSKCGKVFGENERVCDHLNNDLLNYFVDENGKKRIVSEICGRMIKNEDGKLVADPNSIEFIEASWVARPAFKGAVVNHFVSQIDKKVAKILEFPHTQFELENLFTLRVADKESAIVLKLIREKILKAKEIDLIERVAFGKMKKFKK